MTTQRSLRLWPGIVLAAVLVLLRYVLPPIVGEAELFGFPLVIVGIIGGVASAAAIAIWWLFFSRAP